MQWQPISEVRDIRYGTVADLKMPSGRVYRAVYGFRGQGCAWWPLPGQARLSPIGKLAPVAFAVQAVGNVRDGDWKNAASQGHASW